MTIFYITDIDEQSGVFTLFHRECFDKLVEQPRHPLYYMTNEDEFLGGDTIAEHNEGCHYCGKHFKS